MVMELPVKASCSQSRRNHASNRKSRVKEAGDALEKETAKKASGKATFPWINSQIIAAAESGNLNKLTATIDTFLPQMNIVNLATALHRLAKMTTHDHNTQVTARRMLLPKLLTTLKDALRHSNSWQTSTKTQALSNMTWALATMQVPDVELIEILATVAHWKLSEFKHFELATLLWAFAKLGSLDHTVSRFTLPIFASAAECLCIGAHEFTFRGLVMIAWAFATSRMYDTRLFHAIGNGLMPHIYTANSQELANTAWSFSTAGVHNETLFKMLADVSIPRLSEFKPQEISSLVWSFAAIGDNNDLFYEAVAVAVRGFTLQSQQLANILWALTRSRARLPSSQAAVLALLPRCIALIQTFKPQELASVALAAAKSFGLERDEVDGSVTPAGPLKLPRQVSEYFHALLPLVSSDLKPFSGQSIANIANSFLSVQIGLDTDIFSVVGCEVLTRVEKLENSALLLLLKTLPYAPPSVPVDGSIRMLFAEAAHRMQVFQPREMQTLMRICSSHTGEQDEVDVTQFNDLHSRCMSLANSGVSQYHDNDNTSETLDDGNATKQLDTGKTTSELGIWSAPMTVEFANLGRPPSAWDAAATQNLRASIESAYASRDDSFISKESGNSQLPHYVFSVKNTFLKIEQEDDSYGSSDSDEPPPLPPLPPALSIIPSSVSPEKLAAYRADYARFRVGNAIGAKGELSTTSA